MCWVDVVFTLSPAMTAISSTWNWLACDGPVFRPLLLSAWLHLAQPWTKIPQTPNISMCGAEIFESLPKMCNHTKRMHLKLVGAADLFQNHVSGWDFWVFLAVLNGRYLDHTLLWFISEHYQDYKEQAQGTINGSFLIHWWRLGGCSYGKSWNDVWEYECLVFIVYKYTSLQLVNLTRNTST